MSVAQEPLQRRPYTSVFCVDDDSKIRFVIRSTCFDNFLSIFDSAAGGPYSIGDRCVCLFGCVLSNVFQITTVQFSLILTKLGTRDLCASMQKTMEQVFKILIFKFLAIFKFKSSGASQADGL